jgi:hemerythrin
MRIGLGAMRAFLHHGEPLDFADDTSEKIILAHRATRFSPEQLEVGSSAIFGAVDVLIPSSQDYLRQRAYGHLAPVFPDATPAELNGLLRSPIVDFNAGSLILRRGKMASHVYLLLSGTVEQIVPGLEAPLNVVSGALLGGQALSGTGMLTDSWRAASPVRAMRIGLGAMRAFLHHGERFERWQSRWEEITFMRMTKLFGERISLLEQDRLAGVLRFIEVKKGQAVHPAADAFCLIRKGELAVKYSERSTEHVGAGGFIGEEAVLGKGPSTWTARATKDCVLAWIPSDAVRRLPIVMWKMLESHDKRQCAAALGLA